VVDGGPPVNAHAGRPPRSRNVTPAAAPASFASPGERNGRGSGAMSVSRWETGLSQGREWGRREDEGGWVSAGRRRERNGRGSGAMSVSRWETGMPRGREWGAERRKAGG
jgi:hypothetical protein